MSEDQENSSLPLLLTISAAVLLTAGAGWYLLDDDFSVQTETSEPEADKRLLPPVDETIEGGAIESVNVDVAPKEETDETSVEVSDIEPAALRLDTNLRKARLAAESEILAYPVEQSALFYYNQILAVDPDHAIASAELDSVHGKIAQTVSAHIAAEEYADAYGLAVLVARRNPGHELVLEVTQELDRLTNVFVEQAIRFAQDGDDSEVTTALSAAEGLPGRNPEYFSAVRESISNIQKSRISAEQSRRERVRLAAVQATTAWVEKVRSAIAAGRLITPAGQNAVDYLAERDSPKSQKEALTNELVAALYTECTAKIGAARLDEADQLLIAATNFVGDNPDSQALKSELESAFVDAESAKILALDNFVRLKVVPARYPRRAEIRNLSGWVDVVFTVSTSGQTENIEVKEAEPAEIFDDAAMAAVEQWIFEPRVFRGQTINQRTGVRLAFRIE